MRELVKRLIRPLLRVPVVGRLLRTAQATWRGPVNGVRLDQVEESARHQAAELAALRADGAACCPSCGRSLRQGGGCAPWFLMWTP
jgi:hypothetical protein